MLVTSLSNFKKNTKSLLKSVKSNFEELIITTKEANYVVIEQNEYNALMETLYLMKDKEMMEALNSKDDKSTKYDSIGDAFEDLGS
ncbi:type II toxin-antitoxin system Phd/YefM family antitoxin [Flammeovirga yaeyamensis]|uniref:Antitoxin n=1 Tax=Flammeovirga yaeyamensis TaxID=367791 RepID=A0AAX1NF06_9BACT|nr:type II toxin-antitoxin system Phd/YefM family antitoxin [Flammeovirga yaeyamensis]MBB3696710.1 antitoxin YefM [Flammeovirga yaeyamensis]NMF33381.1 type II toxin-antitoxin system Phd/YefM family antitoxin [Flammeovirga yaeyamensis]QWG05345.1 type II toxin-antitoxin system Phd/YefM family antitoxin [Flammeovirga yaeyamensis]